MGYFLAKESFDKLIKELSEDYFIYAPKRLVGGGAFSDTDSIRYEQIQSGTEIEFQEKSHFSFKEVLLPISQTLFYFTEEMVKEADAPKKGALIFLRSCDLHAVKRLDEIYLHNGPADHYYKRIRDKVQFVLMGCHEAFEDCFCTSMGTNRSSSEQYRAAVDLHEMGFYMENLNPEWNAVFDSLGEACEGEISFVKETPVTVELPEGISQENLTAVFESGMWNEYDARCVSCGRCNFVCPTCTCFTMQDIFYTDNGKVGERRRVWASCMVDGFTDVAGGGSYRKSNGQRMRFKTMHKVCDYKKRNGYHMCVGCGRCDRICPEYISFSEAVNKLSKTAEKLNKAAKEVGSSDAE